MGAKRAHGGGDLSYDELVSLPYLDAVYKETLRVYVFFYFCHTPNSPLHTIAIHPRPFGSASTLLVSLSGIAESSLTFPLPKGLRRQYPPTI